MGIPSEDEFRKVLAKNIKMYRKETQEVIAEKSEISIDALSKTEREESTITAYNLLKIANAIGVSTNDLVKPLITNEDKVVEDELWREILNLDLEEKNFLIKVIDFMKTHKKK